MSRPIPRPQAFTERALHTLEHFLHIEAVSGFVLLATTVIALIWANSSISHTYHDLWHTEIGLSVGSFSISNTLHFWINDALMTIFFLVVGMEIRREIHQGALANIRLATLPIVAALGGVAVPALIYAALNPEPAQLHGWAIPTATDIAFAVGVLALLGKSIPPNVRILLLALAIIDDIVAVLVIAVFYSGGLDPLGFLIGGIGIATVFAFQILGFTSAYAYVLPGAIIWFGLLTTGAHPTLAGVVLGLLTPIHSKPTREPPLLSAKKALSLIESKTDQGNMRTDTIAEDLKALKKAQREMLPPVIRVQMALHPWVAYGVMPLFALANAGVSFGGVDWTSTASMHVLFGVLIALVVGKPVGILLSTWIAIRAGLCSLPKGVTWSHVMLIGLLAGIGFTMSIFIAMLAFDEEHLVGAAKMGVLFASVTAALLGLAWGIWQKRKST